MYQTQWTEVEAEMSVSGSALLLGSFGPNCLQFPPSPLASTPSQVILPVGLSDVNAFIPLTTLDAVLSVVRTSGPRVWLVTAGVQSVGSSFARPSHAGVLGLARAVRSEAPTMSLLCIDVPVSTGVPWRAMMSSCADAEVTLRRGRLRASRLAALPARLATAEGTTVRQTASCGGQLLTGGTGGLGLLTARWLAESRGAPAL
eukprot:scaffold102619_cov69-Phaeocystis_antarctica.AAC.1